MNLQSINYPFESVFDEVINPSSVDEAAQKRIKGFIIRCKFRNGYLFQCAGIKLVFLADRMDRKTFSMQDQQES